MSFWTGFKTFFDKVGAEIEKLFGGKASLEQKIQAVITYVGPVVTTLVSLAAGGPAAAIVSRVIAAIQADLATASALVQGATVAAGSTTAQSVTAALNSVKQNLSALLIDADVKSSANAAKITAAVNLVVGELEAAISELSPAAPVTPAVKAA